MDTRLTNVQRDVLKNELIVDHLKEEIEVLADCDSKIDRLRNNLEELEYLMRTDEVINDAYPYDDDSEPEFGSITP